MTNFGYILTNDLESIEKTHKIKAVENSFTKDEHGEEGEEELEEDLDDIL